MKLPGQLHVPPHIPSFQPNSQGVSTPMASGPEKGAGGSQVEKDLSHENARASRYPDASEQEALVRARRGGFKFNFFNKLPKPPVPKPPKPPVPKPPVPKLPVPKPPVPKPPKPTLPKPAGGPNGVGDAINSSKAIGNLHKNNAFTPIASQLAASARSSFLNTGVSTLINLPFSVGEHLASKAIADRIAAQAEMPGAETKSADGTTSTKDPHATEQQKLEARLENAEIKTEIMINTILSINEGPSAKAVGQDPKAETTIGSRLGALENRMTATESQMEQVAKRYGLIYDPYMAPESLKAPDEKSRMDVVEKRYAHMNKMVKRLIRNAEADREEAE